MLVIIYMLKLQCHRYSNQLIILLAFVQLKIIPTQKQLNKLGIVTFEFTESYAHALAPHHTVYQRGASTAIKHRPLVTRCIMLKQQQVCHYIAVYLSMVFVQLTPCRPFALGFQCQSPTCKWSHASIRSTCLSTPWSSRRQYQSRTHLRWIPCLLFPPWYRSPIQRRRCRPQRQSSLRTNPWNRIYSCINCRKSE